MNAQSLFLDLSARGIVLEIADEKLIFDAPRGVLTETDRAELRRLKPELLLLLQSGAATAPPVAPADDVPPALLEYPDRTFDERLKVWRRGDLIEYTRGTAPAYRKLWERRRSTTGQTAKGKK